LALAVLQAVDTAGTGDGIAHRRHLTCLELFAGPGGLALGTHNAGFEHLGLIEFEATAAATLRENCRGPLNLDPATVIEEDARDVDYAPFAGKVDLLTAGPPCQPFSMGGHGKGPDDDRNMFPILLDAIAYCPLGRGFLTGRIKSIDDVEPDNIGRSHPRFHGENVQRSLNLVARVQEMARAKACAPAQLALTWVVVPLEQRTLRAIPGLGSD
jgi:hypothetical protein